MRLPTSAREELRNEILSRFVDKGYRTHDIVVEYPDYDVNSLKEFIRGLVATGLLEVVRGRNKAMIYTITDSGRKLIGQ
jgi:predicted transcriptional regulator